jgi:hypothetical protein
MQLHLEFDAWRGIDRSPSPPPPSFTPNSTPGRGTTPPPTLPSKEEGRPLSLVTIELHDEERQPPPPFPLNSTRQPLSFPSADKIDTRTPSPPPQEKGRALLHHHHHHPRFTSKMTPGAGVTLPPTNPFAHGGRHF